jgi:hypothetical protein
VRSCENLADFPGKPSVVPHEVSVTDLRKLMLEELIVPNLMARTIRWFADYSVLLIADDS